MFLKPPNLSLINKAKKGKNLIFYLCMIGLQQVLNSSSTYLGRKICRRKYLFYLFYEIVKLQIQGSRMFIPDPKTTKHRGKKNCCQTFLCSHKSHKFENYFSFVMLKKKVIGLFTQKMSLRSQKYGFGIWDPEKNISRIQGSKRHRIRNTALKSQFSDLVPDPDQRRWLEIFLQV